ncbi:MAG: outer membrane beta-barrel protein, partial [Terracidiphilus sp.]
MSIRLNLNRLMFSIAGTALTVSLSAVAQTPAAPPPASDQAPASAPATPAQTPAPPAAPAAAPTWSVGPMDISGLIDGYYSYNANRPSDTANGQINDLYNFNDKTDQFNLSEARLTLNHDPDPVGAHIDVFYGRTNTLVNGGSHDQGDYIEQAFLSLKPPKAKGLELDFGKFVTSAGAEVIESKDNWNYSRSLLFAWAIPYFHFGLRSSLPVSKVETIGVQVVNGWNNVTNNNGGVTIGLTSALVKPKYTWNVNYYTGPSNAETQKGYRNLIDMTLLLTPNAKFNAYLNYDYGQNRDAITGSGTTAVGDNKLNHWQGVAFAVHEQFTGTSALAGRFEFFHDTNGFQTGVAQEVKEFTGTYEYKWVEGLLIRIEYRRDWSDEPYFHKGNTNFVDAQSTVTG